MEPHLDLPAGGVRHGVVDTSEAHQARRTTRRVATGLRSATERSARR